ncbi:undecaprenyldiphospho-muramoylpentapeptide beta-N-acetylglucosaminyltransferase [bacterium AH-315-P15]|nr:undecaprenyldiphospho-muramoylpentapeptide beta-N-acetylglucosaminyltransferase [bacterium AH-315-P15]
MAGSERGTIVLGAGGSGGHIFPAQAVAQELVRRGFDIVLITDDRGKSFSGRFVDTRIEIIHAATFAGRNPLKLVAALFRILGGIGQAFGLLDRFKAKAAVGFGGYSSLPTMVAARLRGVPSCLHDPNAVLGRVNRLLAGHVDIIGAAFENMQGVKSRHKDKIRMIGNPLRDEVITAREVAYAPPGKDGPITLLVFGGSQGAAALAEVVPAAIALLPEALKIRLHVSQQARVDAAEEVQRDYDDMGVRADVAPFFTNLPERMAGAHLVIARAGASTVTELGAIGRPSILVPLPTAMDDHQSVNAEALTDPGGAWLMPQSELTAERLADKLRSLLCDGNELARAAEAAKGTGRPNATSDFADLIEELIASKAKRGH